MSVQAQPTQGTLPGVLGAGTVRPMGAEAFDRCMLAAEAMATSSAPLGERLKEAWTSHLDPLQAESLRPDVRAAFVKLRKGLSKVEDREHGSVHATLDAATDAEVEELAKLAWEVIAGVLDAEE